MATKGPAPLPVTLVAAEDFGALTQGYPVIARDASGNAILCNGAGDRYCGIADTGVQKANSGQHQTALLGPCLTKGRVGLAVTNGQYLTAQSGWLIPANKQTYTGSVFSNLGSKNAVCGEAWETVSSGGIATVRMFETWTYINS